MKTIVTIIPTSLVINLLLSLFCSFIETKNKNQIFSNIVLLHSFQMALTSMKNLAYYKFARQNSNCFSNGMSILLVWVLGTIVYYDNINFPFKVVIEALLLHNWFVSVVAQ